MIAAREAAKAAMKYQGKKAVKKTVIKAAPSEKASSPLRELNKELMKKQVKEGINKRLKDKKPEGVLSGAKKPYDEATKPLKNQKGMAIIPGKKLMPYNYKKDTVATVDTGGKRTILPSRLEPKQIAPNQLGQEKAMGSVRKDDSATTFGEEMINKDINMGNTSPPWKPKGKNGSSKNKRK